ncbi:host-nuclease inhibitor Gam family protein [Roseomonas sp. HJA6]|uniref:Host-nuclease inhibitor Gam family protein n=1 Tax=Roseomonas alba TaxID=2846776 RepID=A0ABS7AB56_9PROT|nr:host-nuclease inhibitor Gam family protein [Neoroseomonas alba]MBW6399534.1 host-nuclease inhibitor Gam family protein [Neoroseomonas alba]
MTRTKRKAETVPAARDQAEAETWISRIGELQRSLVVEQAALAETIAKAKAMTADTVATINAELDALTRGVQIWAEAHRHTLTDGGRRKTVALGTGSVLWRLAPPAVRIKGPDAVLAYLLKHGREEFLRRKIEIDKAAMLGMPGVAGAIPGVTIASSGEEFVVEPAGAKEVAA